MKEISELNLPEDVRYTEDHEWTKLEDAPELVNNEPYEGGWLIEVKPEDAAELDALVEKSAYMEVLKG